MIELDDLLRYKESELKDLLDNNKYVRKNALVFVDNTITQVAGTCKNSIFLKSGEIVDNNTSYLLTYDQLKRLRESKYKGGKDGNIKYLKLVLIKILRELYGNERFDVVDSFDINCIEVTVWYPEITITNSAEESTTIRDLYIRYKFCTTKDTGIQLFSIRAYKNTFTVGEIDHQYLHSHISWSDGIGKWSSKFCFGDTAFKQFTAICYNGNMSSIDIYQLFLGMDNYLKWESLEGSPYNYLRNAVPYKLSSISISSPSDNFINSCVDYVLQRCNNFQYTTDTENGKIKLKITSSFNEIIKDFLRLTGSENFIGRVNGSSFVKVTTYDEDYYNRLVDNYSNITLRFKGEDLPITIVKPDVNLSELETKFPLQPYPEIVSKVKRIIEKKFEEYLINRE